MRLRSVMYGMCIFMIIFFTKSAFCQQQYDILWEIGERNGSFWEFNHFKTGERWPWKFKISQVGTPNAKEFPQEINDSVRRPIMISFYLNQEYMNRDLILVLETVNGHGPDFTIGFSLKIPPGPQGQQEASEGIGVKTFKTHESDKQEVVIHRRSLQWPGWYTIAIDNASPPWTNRWIFWDYLALKAPSQQVTAFSLEVIEPKDRSIVYQQRNIARGVCYSTQQQRNLFVIPFIETNKYYKQPHEDLTFRRRGNRYEAEWSLEYFLGLEGKAGRGTIGYITFYVVNETTLQHIIETFPDHDSHREPGFPYTYRSQKIKIRRSLR